MKDGGPGRRGSGPSQGRSEISVRSVADGAGSCPPGARPAVEFTILDRSV